MKNTFVLTTLALALLTSSAYADTNVQPEPTPVDNGGAVVKSSEWEKAMYEGAPVPKYTPQQKKSLSKIDNVKTDPKRNYSNVNGQGDVIFTYGAQSPNVLCSVLTVCDIELEAGEVINSVNLGDPSRWNVEPAVTGYGENQTQHILIKPMDVGLNTNMLIATDRRGYRIDLTSTQSKYYPHVLFSYPEKLLAQFNAKRMVEQERKEKQSITTDVQTGAKTYLGDLNFNYEVNGNVSWKPIRVYDDGQKTIIELPKEVKYAKAPALMLLSRKGGLFTDEKTDIINYRLQANRYVVDGIFETAILTMGLDSDQQRVVIKHLKK